MTTSLPIFAVAATCCLAAWLIHRYSRVGGLNVPFWVSTALCGLVIGSMIGMLTSYALAKKERAYPEVPTPASIRVWHQLEKGDKINELRADGWLNGIPLKFRESTFQQPTVDDEITVDDKAVDETAIAIDSPRLFVLDIWTDWCPVCRDAAPLLVATHEKFKDRGVEFISVTVMPESSAQKFANNFQIQWPTGFGASLDTMLAYGALDPASSQGINPMASNFADAHVVPTIYILSDDGTILWSDKQSRYLHKPLDEIANNLEAALELELTEKSSPAQSSPN